MNNASIHRMISESSMEIVKAFKQDFLTKQPVEKKVFPVARPSAECLRIYSRHMAEARRHHASQ